MALCTVLLLTGCASYSNRGLITNLPTETKKTQNVCCFVLEDYSIADIKDNCGDDVLSYLVRSIKKERIEGALLQSYPEMFGSQSSRVPIAVTVRFDAADNDWSGLAVYFLSLGILPGKKEYQDRCTVQVELIAGDELVTLKRAVVFSGIEWITVFSPFALMMSEPPPNNKGFYRAGSNAFSRGPKYQHMKEVYLETVCAAILSCLSEVDQNELQRKVLLNRVKKVQ